MSPVFFHNKANDAREQGNSSWFFACYVWCVPEGSVFHCGASFCLSVVRLCFYRHEGWEVEKEWVLLEARNLSIQKFCPLLLVPGLQIVFLSRLEFGPVNHLHYGILATKRP
jgi:hypothetical protein